MAKQEVKKEEVKVDSTSTVETPEQKVTAVTEDGKVSQIETASGEVILNAGKDVIEGDPKSGIEEKSKGAKDVLDTQKKAEQAIQDGTSGLDPIAIAEVQGGLVKDVNSDRGVYPTASAAMAALTASGKLATESSKED